jgi:hypothetical protein
MTVRDAAMLANPTIFQMPRDTRKWHFLMREIARYTVGGNQKQVWNIAHHNVALRALSAAPAVAVVIPGTAGLWAYQFSGVANLQLEFTLAMPADVLNDGFRLLFTVHWGPSALAAAAAPQAVQWKYEIATQTVGAAVGAGAEPVDTVTPNTTAVAEDYLVNDFPNPIDCSTLQQTVIGRLWRDGVADACNTAVWLWRLQASLYEV